MLAEAKKVINVVQMPAQERRGSVRYPFTAAADVVELRSQARMGARSSDLGRGGCFIDTISPFPVGTSVSLRLTVEQKTFETQARVVYVQPGMGMGLAFTSAEPDQLWVLEKWLGKLSGEMPLELAGHEIPDQTEPESPAPSHSQAEPGFVLNELIIALMRKRVLTESEGKLLLKKLVG